MSDSAQRHDVMLFDGVCNLCNATVNFVLDRERGTSLRFAALQSDAGKAFLASHSIQARGDALDTVIFVEGERVYVRSSAALHIARRLRAPWSWLYVLIVVPRPIRDAVYRFVARHRYRWFGTRDACRVPTPELRARFLT